MPFVDIVIALIAVGLIAWFLNVRGALTGDVRLTMNVVLMLIVVGIALWLVNTFIPMAPAIKGVLNFVVVIATLVGILRVFGLWDGIVRFWSNLTSHHQPR
jgi:undecaprenyl pyrophosphate phosphatase UppP